MKYQKVLNFNHLLEDHITHLPHQHLGFRLLLHPPSPFHHLIYSIQHFYQFIMHFRLLFALMAFLLLALIDLNHLYITFQLEKKNPLNSVASFKFLLHLQNFLINFTFIFKLFCILINIQIIIILIYIKIFFYIFFI